MRQRADSFFPVASSLLLNTHFVLSVNPRSKNSSCFGDLRCSTLVV